MPCPCMWGWGFGPWFSFGWFGWIIGAIIALLFLILIVLVIVWVVRSLMRISGDYHQHQGMSMVRAIANQ
ncbi:MAG: hypothetical protein ACP5L5_01605 [Vulcanisaeta sp.]|uniref:hypothetical protein n=1 Tax=Vulcanisaeta sp. TaxID=2020871 RepID=UPI003D0DBB41